MTKKEFIANVAAASGLSIKESETAINALIKVIRDTMHRGERISLVGFGSFAVVERKARRSYNPQKREMMQVPAKKIVKFNPGKDLDIDSKPVGGESTNNPGMA